MLVVVLDQVTKTAVLRRVGRGDPRLDEGRFRAVFARGWLRSTPSAAPYLVMWAVSASAMVALASIRTSGVAPIATVGLALALGGAAGNLVDRLRYGAVIDFIALGWWPVFNFADVAIVAGAGIVVATVI
jgi:signal peptidase II